jgi:hypothetical protein
MLPHLKTGGKVAYRRLVVHMGVPEEFRSVSLQTLDGAKARPALRPPVTLAEVTVLLGARA